MSRRVRAGLVCGIALLCSACVPWPHYERYTPPIVGLVTFKGQPVAGAKVSVISTDFAGVRSTGTQDAVTDVQGRFKLDPIREFYLFVFVVGDRFSHATLTVTDAGKAYAGLGEVSGLSDGPIEIDCELAAPVAGLQQERFCQADFGSPVRPGPDVHALLKRSDFVSMEKLAGSDYRPLYRIEICPTNGCDAFESASSWRLDDYVYLYSVYVARFPDFTAASSDDPHPPMAFIKDAEDKGYAQQLLDWYEPRFYCGGSKDLPACVLEGMRKQGAIKHYDVNYDEGRRTQTLVTDENGR